MFQPLMEALDVDESGRLESQELKRSKPVQKVSPFSQNQLNLLFEAVLKT
jgi:hypothetical protein